MTDVVPDLNALMAALDDVCERFGAATASAGYISPVEGRLVTLHVTAGGVAYLADEDDNVLAVRGAVE